MQSLTGFGRSMVREGNSTVSCEILALNKKGIEIQIFMPKEYQYLEVDIRKKIETLLIRGKISVSLKIEHDSGKRVTLDINAFKNWRAQIKKLNQLLGRDREPEISEWLQLRDIWKVDDSKIPEKNIKDIVFSSLEASVAKVLIMRKREGSFLKTELFKLLKNIESTTKELEKWVTVIRKKADHALDLKIKTISTSPEESDLMARIKSLFVDKGDVAEEITRLYSHCEQFRILVNSGDPVGRTLDFLMQEIHREINTIGSKSGDSNISKKVLSLKTVSEQIREQVQNLL